MFAKHVVVGCLLLSGIAQVSAMEPEMGSDDSLNSAQVGSVEPEVEVAVPETTESVSMDSSMKDMHEDGSMESMHKEMMQDMHGDKDMQAMHEGMMKKKMTPASEMGDEMSMSVEEETMPSADVSMAQEPKSEDSRPAMMEDKTDNQDHADVQGVFESMSREEEDESFPG